MKEGWGALVVDLMILGQIRILMLDLDLVWLDGTVEKGIRNFL